MVLGEKHPGGDDLDESGLVDVKRCDLQEVHGTPISDSIICSSNIVMYSLYMYIVETNRNHSLLAR